MAIDKAFVRNITIHEGGIDLNKKERLKIENVSAIITASIFLLAGAIPIFVSMGLTGGLSTRAISSLIMVGIFVSGILSIFLSLHFKMPIYAAPSITAVAIIIPLLKNFSLEQMIMGYLLAGVVVSILGGLNLIEKLVTCVPIPIVLAMVGGVYMSYGLDLIAGVKKLPLAAVIVAAYFLVTLISKKIPSQAAALITAVVITFFLLKRKGFTGESLTIEWFPPIVAFPEMEFDVFVYISLPLVIMAISDIFKGYGVLKANGFDVTLNKVAFWCGISSIISSFGMGHTISLSGPTIAIVAGQDAGPKQSRYKNVIAFSGISLGIALLAGVVISLITLLPTEVVDVICGLAMIGLLTSSLTGAFGERRFTLGALVAFVVGLSHISIVGIGAPVWAIIFGIVVSLVAEREDFR